MRGATGWPSSGPSPAGYFNPRAPYGARPIPFDPVAAAIIFQSSRPLRGATNSAPDHEPIQGFQSSRPLRGATGIASKFVPKLAFQSPRPLRGATALAWWHFLATGPFQSPRPLRGATALGRIASDRRGFQSPRPLRGATAEQARIQRDWQISIPAPLAGRDTPISW